VLTPASMNLFGLDVTYAPKDKEEKTTPEVALSTTPQTLIAIDRDFLLTLAIFIVLYGLSRCAVWPWLTRPRTRATRPIRMPPKGDVCPPTTRCGLRDLKLHRGSALLLAFLLCGKQLFGTCL
jgi:hypothetical protein